MSIKKIDRASALIQKNKNLFKCPVCSGTMFMNSFGSLTCHSAHSFDVARKGSINLLTARNTPVYSKELFEARHKICEAGFYDPLTDALVNIITEYKKARNDEKMNILDAGCGEGSHISSVYKKVTDDQNNTYVGVDISKDSINIAARNHGDIIWCVADLARLPFQNRRFNVVFNILSPANYSEFVRILKDQGMVIKVVPGVHYLRELREIIHKDQEVSDGSDNKVLHYFGEKLEVQDIQKIYYTFNVHRENLSHLIKMTPLTWGENMEQLNHIYEKNLASITVDLTIIIGTQKP